MFAGAGETTRIIAHGIDTVLAKYQSSVEYILDTFQAMITLVLLVPATALTLYIITSAFYHNVPTAICSVDCEKDVNDHHFLFLGNKGGMLIAILYKHGVYGFRVYVGERVL